MCAQSLESATKACSISLLFQYLLWASHMHSSVVWSTGLGPPLCPLCRSLLCTGDVSEVKQGQQRAFEGSCYSCF